MSTNADMPAMPPHDGEVWVDPKDTRRGTITAYGLTKREHACIALRVPETGDPELDALIREARRMDVTQAAIAQELAWETRPHEDYNLRNAANRACKVADALLAALEPKP